MVRAMNDLNVRRQLISRLHDAVGKFVIAATGGGSSAVAELLAVPGASRTVIEGTVPYDPASLSLYIGGPPDQACSGITARAMAMASFQRAHRFEPDERVVFGIGCTAALTTDRERRGSDRCFVALQSIGETREFELRLSREHRDRESQEAACTSLILWAMAVASGVEATPPGLYEDESLEERIQPAEPSWMSLYRGETNATDWGSVSPTALFPGAFNPLHDGHRQMAAVAARRTGGDVLLEVSAINVDKPALDYIAMAERQAGIGGELPLVFTNAPTFTAKASLFPDTVFVVGVDTLERIGQPRYYHDSHELRDIAIRTIADHGVRFLVFGREMDGAFCGLDGINIPDALRAIAEGVPEREFRVDLSSTHLRTREQRD